ncbi:DUF2939 domain-containing protein [Microbulbifer hainanensis]|uniref:DUF2939 domain-containing protein n=1 Tax=Microbulbifer hainanensis TaxID=2735675 RepID=UPI00186949FE|nr:DUF2939 domain-containing protein [Microbulbifer hainanensis]
MKKWLWITLLALMVVAAGYVALPRYTVAKLEEAARAEDIEALQQYVDFPALRDNLKVRVQRHLVESMGDSVPPEFGELLTAGTNLFIGPLLRQLVTPRGISDLLRGGKNLQAFERELYRESMGDTVNPPPDDVEQSGDWQLQAWRFTGLNQVSADYGENGEVALRLIMERQGLHWRLVDIALLNDEMEKQ